MLDPTEKMDRVVFGVLWSSWESSCCCCVQLGDVVMNRCKLAFGRVLGSKSPEPAGFPQGALWVQRRVHRPDRVGLFCLHASQALSGPTLEVQFRSLARTHSFGFTVQNGWEASSPQTTRQPRKQPSVFYRRHRYSFTWERHQPGPSVFLLVWCNTSESCTNS